MASEIMDHLAEVREQAVFKEARRVLGSLIQEDQYVGEVFSLGYETALVQIHDHHRQEVGGIPSLSFLVATRISTGTSIEFTDEDSSLILLRVMDAAPLPNEADALRVRVETAQRVSGEHSQHWDAPESMDPSTHNLLSFAGIRCRVIGTFYLELAAKPRHDADLVLKFGSDISNYYPNRGLKVYKPNGDALKSIVNYRDPGKVDRLSDAAVTIGTVRYASTDRAYQGVSEVPVSIMPDDLLSQKTALFGMTRTGKSNTTKIILKSVFGLRDDATKPLRIGQLVLDPNGEYANENYQDENSRRIPTAIKNLKSSSDPSSSDVVTYGILPHRNDPERRLMLLNFFRDENLQTGKEIIDAALADDTSKYTQNFTHIHFDPPHESDRSGVTRYRRRVLAYRALLAKAGFQPPENIRPITIGLFNQKLIDALKEAGSPSGQSSDNAPLYLSTARYLSESNPSWSQVGESMRGLREFIVDKAAGYQKFEDWYINERSGASGDSWADEDLKKILEMFHYPNGARQLGKVRGQHTHETGTDYADDIYQDLIDGRLVIVDQSSGEPALNQTSAERIMWKIFRENQKRFRETEVPPDILIYVEEAHNLLPKNSEEDLQNVWVRAAKEGAKYHIGMVYATQEVSSIQRNILKNTGNWFIAHLNNTDETKELTKYYDFADFEASIRRAQDAGFIRIKTLSNKFVLPAQVEKFEV